jgi:hypothetical protein
MKSGLSAARALIGLTLVYPVVMPLAGLAVVAGYVAFKVGGAD